MEKLNAAFEYLNKFKDLHILCVGDIMLDRFVYGSVKRISPEAPVPVLKAAYDLLVMGGVGNVAANLCALDCHAHMIGVVGADDTARDLKEEAYKYEKLTPYWIEDSSRVTSLKTRFLAGHQQILRSDMEDTHSLSEDIKDVFKKTFTKILPKMDTIILSDYGKGILSEDIIRFVIDAANKSGIPILVDPKGTNYAKYSGADIITPNKEELSGATDNMPVESDIEIESATEFLLAISGINTVIATRSAEGMSIRQNGQDEIVHLPTIARDVFDVSGAGDTVIATIAAATAAGADRVMAARLANATGGLAVEKVGTATIRQDELRSFLLEEGHILFGDTKKQHQSTGQTFAPIMSLENAKDQVERWRQRGLKVGFTNGCFDILHQGHVTLLDKARMRCDRLIVGLNTDSSIARLKGPTRPVNPQQARAFVLAALQSVDMVVFFGEEPAEDDKPLALMEHLRPDVIFKGNDYTIEQVVGADLVQSYGGAVELIPLEEGFSTTSTIQKMVS